MNLKFWKICGVLLVGVGMLSCERFSLNQVNAMRTGSHPRVQHNISMVPLLNNMHNNGANPANMPTIGPNLGNQPVQTMLNVAPLRTLKGNLDRALDRVKNQGLGCIQGKRNEVLEYLIESFTESNSNITNWNNIRCSSLIDVFKGTNTDWNLQGSPGSMFNADPQRIVNRVKRNFKELKSGCDMYKSRAGWIQITSASKNAMRLVNYISDVCEYAENQLSRFDNCDGSQQTYNELILCIQDVINQFTVSANSLEFC